MGTLAPTLELAAPDASEKVQTANPTTNVVFGNDTIGTAASGGGSNASSSSNVLIYGLIGFAIIFLWKLF